MDGIFTQVAPDLYIIDQQFQGTPHVIASYLIPGDNGHTLIESGPTTTNAALLAGIRAAGFDPADITQVVLTHVHLDHAGGAGVLLTEHLPKARVLVHKAGGQHMIDPTKLVASAGRIYGDDMDRLWGEVRPVPADRVDILDDGDTVVAGRRTLTALDTPGHAGHHMAYHDAEHGIVFTGDVAGIRVGPSPIVRPPTVPPEYSPELWLRSAARVRALNPSTIYLTHFGGFDDATRHFDDLISRMFYWTGLVEGFLVSESDTKKVEVELHRRGDAEMLEAVPQEGLLVAYQLAGNYQMAVDGIARYVRKRDQRRAEQAASTP